MLCDTATSPRRAAARAAVPASDFGAATHWGADGNDGEDGWDDVEDHRAHRFTDLGFTDRHADPAPLHAPKGRHRH